MTVLSSRQVREGYADSKGNSVSVGENVYISEGTRVHFDGSDCSLRLGANSLLDGVIFFKREGGSFSLGRRSKFRGKAWLGNECTITMGDSIYCGDDLQMSLAEATAIVVGDDCLISDACRIRTDDSHPFYDAQTGRRVNLSRDVFIGDHVWIGMEAVVMPGANVGVGCIIGARAVVTASLKGVDRSVIAGHPAMVVRERIKWTREHLQNTRNLRMRVDPGVWGE